MPLVSAEWPDKVVGVQSVVLGLVRDLPQPELWFKRLLFRTQTPKQYTFD